MPTNGQFVVDNHSEGTAELFEAGEEGPLRIRANPHVHTGRGGIELISPLIQ